MRAAKYEGGFSLVEVLVAVLLVGLAIAALVVTNSSFTQANAAGTYLSTAEFLAEQIRELTILLPVVDPQTEIATFGPEAGEPNVVDYDDLDDFDGASFTPPINSKRLPLNEFVAFTQQVTVQNVNAGDFEQIIPDHGSPFVRVTVKVFLKDEEIVSIDWVRAWYVPQ
jgi:prepilin-type N-terminal cleavage/methylation domain-containing protein